MLVKEFKEIPKVGVLDLDVPEFHRDLLQTVNGALSFEQWHEPLLFGGSVRDHVYNTFVRPEDVSPITPRDYDIIVRAPDGLFASKTDSQKTNAQMATQHALDQLASYPGFKGTEILDPAYSFDAGRITFQYDGKNVEVLVTRPWSPNEEFVEYYTDSPINGIGITLSGQTLIQLECIDHLQNQIYRFDQSITRDRFLERMRKMREHYPHMRGLLLPTNPYDEKHFIKNAPEIKEEGLLILPNDPAYRRFIGGSIHDLEWWRSEPTVVTLQL